MREILFRGKRVDGKRWEQGYYTNLPTETESGGLPDGYKDFICTLNSLNHDLIEVAPETVGQYTGSNDKNGTKIFEGDIVTDGAFNYVVDFYGGAWCLRLCKDSGSWHCLYAVSHQREIIGNIHDNPKLLGGDTP